MGKDDLLRAAPVRRLVDPPTTETGTLRSASGWLLMDTPSDQRLYATLSAIGGFFTLIEFVPALGLGFVVVSNSDGCISDTAAEKVIEATLLQVGGSSSLAA